MSRIKKGLSDEDKAVILAYAENAMNTMETARRMNYSRSNIENHRISIEELTGLDMRNLWELLELYRMAGGDIEAAMARRKRERDGE